MSWVFLNFRVRVNMVYWYKYIVYLFVVPFLCAVVVCSFFFTSVIAMFSSFDTHHPHIFGNLFSFFTVPSLYLPLLRILHSLATNNSHGSSREEESEENEVTSDGRAVVSVVCLFDDRVYIVMCLYRVSIVL